jgi:hypothetical protein
MKQPRKPARARQIAASPQGLARSVLLAPDHLLEPPARERIFARVLERTAIAGGVTTVTAAGGDWRVLAPGVALKVLQRDPRTGMASYLVRYAAGARVERHPQGSVEECMLVSGDLLIDDAQMRPGDWQVALPGGQHGPLSSRAGALVFVRGILRAVPLVSAEA